MDKINFENYPSETSPVSAERLNEMQENIEKATGVVVWENQNTNPMQDFPTQNIDLTSLPNFSTDFNYFEIIYYIDPKLSASELTIKSTGKLKIMDRGYYLEHIFTSGTNAYILSRGLGFNYTNNQLSGIVFSPCYRYQVGTTGSTTVNNCCVPLQIIMYKI